MELRLIPSLASRASVAITVSLWYHEGIVHSTGLQPSRQYKETKDRVHRNVGLLPLPDILKRNLTLAVALIGKEISKWYWENGRLILLDVNWSAELCWTSFGFIDYKATAKNVLRSRELADCHRFSLACINGLDGDIEKLWPCVKQRFNRYLSSNEGLPTLYGQDLLRCFDIFLTKRDDGLINDDQSEKLVIQLLLKALKLGSVPAADYFIRNLSASKRLETVFACATEALGEFFFCSKCFLLLLNHMDSEQLQKFIQTSSPKCLLLRFLEFPLHQFFANVLDKVWYALSKENYLLILVALAIKFTTTEEEVSVYHTTFTEFWQRGSSEYKNYCYDILIVKMLLSLFFPSEPYLELQVLFHDSDIEQRLHAVFLANADALFIVIREKNKQEALRYVMKKYLPANIFVTNFDLLYDERTRVGWLGYYV